MLFGIAGFLLKYGAHRTYSVPHILFGLYASGTLGFFIHGIFTQRLDISLELLIAGVMVGVGSTAGNIYFMRALRIGPVSLTSPLVNLNIVLIVILSVIVYGEEPQLQEVAGIALVILCLALLPVDPHEKISVKDRRWYGLVTFAIVLFFLRNGGLKITEEMGLNNTMVLCYGYLLGAIWSGILSVRSWRSMRWLGERSEARRRGFTVGLVAGVFSFGGMQLYAFGLAHGPASIVSPIFALNSLVTGMLAITLLKERLSCYQIISVIGIVSGIVVLRV